MNHIKCIFYNVFLLLQFFISGSDYILNLYSTLGFVDIKSSRMFSSSGHCSASLTLLSFSAHWLISDGVFLDLAYVPFHLALPHHPWPHPHVGFHHHPLSNDGSHTCFSSQHTSYELHSQFSTWCVCCKVTKSPPTDICKVKLCFLPAPDLDAFSKAIRSHTTSRWGKEKTTVLWISALFFPLSLGINLSKSHHLQLGATWKWDITRVCRKVLDGHRPRCYVEIEDSKTS